VLQESWVGERDWRSWWGDLPIFGSGDMAGWLVEHGLLLADSGMLSIGPEAERRYGRRHFMQLLSVITGTPEFTVLHGRTHIGSASLASLLAPTEVPRVLLLGGPPGGSPTPTGGAGIASWNQRSFLATPLGGVARGAWHARCAKRNGLCCLARTRRSG
jgi:hypothetical protein